MEIHQNWSLDISFDRSHWDLQPCRNKSKNSYEFQLLFQSESLTNFDWNCSALLAIRRCFECFRVLLFLSFVGWLTIDSLMWALFWEVRNRTCIKPGRETRHLKHLQNHGEQDRSTQCCGFFCCNSFLASVSLFPTKYFSLIITGIWLTMRAIKWAIGWLIILNR